VPDFISFVKISGKWYCSAINAAGPGRTVRIVIFQESNEICLLDKGQVSSRMKKGTSPETCIKTADVLISWIIF
jgi:hypothetical protein